ncbi:MAG: hypothetical protein U0641_15820 [Anaerolineae bacterium]
MDFGALLTRSFEITWRQRALWLYGILLAFFGGSVGSGFNWRFPAGSSGGGGSSTPSTTPPTTIPTPELGELGRQLGSIPPGVWVGVIGAIACLIVLWIVISQVVLSVSRGALIGMVGRVETAGRTSIGEGWHFGWSRFGWRVFAIGFLIGLAMFFLGLILAGVFVAFFVGSAGAAASRSGFTAALIPIFCLVLLVVLPLMLLVAFLVTVLYNLATRHTVLADQGVIDSLGAAWGLLRANPLNLFILVVIEVALGIVWAIVLFIVLGIFGAIVAFGPGVAAYAVTQAWGPAFLAAVPGLILTGLLALALSGLWVVFYETLWTLAYGRLTAPPPLAASTVDLAPQPAS